MDLGAGSKVDVTLVVDIITIDSSNDEIRELVRLVVEAVPPNLSIKTAEFLLIALDEEYLQHEQKPYQYR